MDAWLPLIATIIGAGIATGSSYFVMRRQFQYQTFEEKRKYHLQKLEMTYEAVTEMRRLYSETFGHMASITLLQKFRDWKERIILPIEKLTMLITLYSPELVPSLNSIESLRETLGKKIAECLKVSAEPTRVYRESVFDEFYMAYEELDQALKKLQEELSAYASEIYLT